MQYVYVLQRTRLNSSPTLQFLLGCLATSEKMNGMMTSLMRSEFEPEEKLYLGPFY